MRRNAHKQWLVHIAIVLMGSVAAWADERAKAPALIAKPDAFQTLLGPDCSHCRVEADRRKGDLRADDRVLCWIQVQTDGYINDGAVPIRFFLSKYRVLHDGWGVWVYDPDAGFARGFAPDGGPFQFHGWRNGIMVMKGKDGSLYSCLTGIAFEGLQKGNRLEPRPTLVSDWGFWHEEFPQAVAYTMYDKYQPVELPTVPHEDSLATRGPADARLPADTQVLGVWDGKHARAYPLDVLKKAGVIHDTANGQPRIVLWYDPTGTAAAYRQPFGTSGLVGDAGWIFSIDRELEAAPFVDKRTNLHWDITGRSVGGGPRLAWLDSVQVKWFAWAAEYPETSIYGVTTTSFTEPDYKRLAGNELDSAKPHGNLDVTSRSFAMLKAADLQRHRVTLLLDGETESKEWPLRPGAELWCSGSWGRLDQFAVGDRVLVWFEKDVAQQPARVSLLADELSEQAFYTPLEVKAVNLAGSDPGTMTLESPREKKPVVRTVKLATAEVYRGSARAPHDSLTIGETIFVQTTGDHARLILDAEAFEKQKVAQVAVLRQRWTDEGLPGTLIFSHPQSHEIELMLDHEAMAWGRSLREGDKVTLQTSTPILAAVKQLRPWRERTQLLLGLESFSSDPSALVVGQRVALRLTSPPLGCDENRLPTGWDKSQSKTQRVEWIMASIYCTCEMHDGCAGHVFTLAACDAGPGHTCGLAKDTRKSVAELIDQGQTDRQIFENLLKERGPNLARPHLLQ